MLLFVIFRLPLFNYGGVETTQPILKQTLPLLCPVKDFCRQWKLKGESAIYYEWTAYNLAKAVF
jgi:hypothetical protein